MKRIAAVVTVVLLVLGTVRFFTVKGAAPEPAASPSSAPARPAVETVVAAYAPVQSALKLTGQVALTEAGHADVTAPLTGVVVEPLVKVGQHVERGAPITVINNAFGQTSLQLLQKLEQDQTALLAAQNGLGQAQSNLNQAEAAFLSARTTLSQAQSNATQSEVELNASRIDYNRKKNLFEGGVAAKSDVEDARSRHLKAQAVWRDMANEIRIARDSVEVARRNLTPARENAKVARESVLIAQTTVQRDKILYTQSQVAGASIPRALTRVKVGAAHDPHGMTSATTTFYVRAPISGTVTAVNMTAGLSVSPGTVIASLADLHTVYVDANAYETDLPAVHVGDPITARSSAFPDQVFHGKVSYVGKQVDPTTHTVAVRSRIENEGDTLRPGLSVEATVSALSPHQALVLPELAVLVEGDHRYVMVDRAGKYEKRTVKEGARFDGKVEIVRGIKAGERVVTRGNLLLTSQD